MEKLHLLCNAHLDPVWLWRWNEGLAEAISTFRVAADFCEQYDGFVFNHNEALLYEWVEEHEPQLFKRIQKLVKEKKWVKASIYKGLCEFVMFNSSEHICSTAS